jgi:ATP-dependent RNA helicase RhlE
VTDTSPWLAFRLTKPFLQAIEAVPFAAPTEIQAKCIPLVLNGQQVVGIAQTGTGKTAAYLLPVLFKLRFAQGMAPRAVVVVPTKELVVQVEKQSRQLACFTDLRVAALYGGVGPKMQIESLKHGVDLLIATPGRFLELYQKNEIATKQIKTLVIDEADRLMDMGFMPQLRRIFEVIPAKRQNLLFSATFSARVEKLSHEFLDFCVRVEITPPATASRQVTQQLYEVPNLKTKINFLDYLLAQPDFTRVMVFTRTKQAADDVSRFLERKKLGPVRVIHSNKGQNSRINAVHEFTEGRLRVLVSTDVAARGIDVSGVSHVINFDVPVQYEDYVHRIGRTGRAMNVGTAITLANPAEVYHIKKIEALMHEKIPVAALPPGLKAEETPFREVQEMAREIDRQKQKEDPSFQGAFHERKKK